MMNAYASTFGTLAMLGGGMLIAGAALVDLGSFSAQPVVASVGHALGALAGAGLICLPLGLQRIRAGGDSKLSSVGSACLVLGTTIVSLVDVPSIVNPANLAAGGAFGPIGLVLLSVGFLLWFAAIHRSQQFHGWRKWIFLAAGLWFFVTFPTIQLPLFVIPRGQPLFVLLSGAFGVLQCIMSRIVREQATIGVHTV